MLVGRMPTVEEGRMIDTMLIVLVDHGMFAGPSRAASRIWSERICSTSRRSNRAGILKDSI
jgi:hypothetical protein